MDYVPHSSMTSKHSIIQEPCLALFRFPPLYSICHSHPLMNSWRHSICGILSGLELGKLRICTDQQKCQPSSACRKYNMIGTQPHIWWISQSGWRLERHLVITLVVHEHYPGKLNNNLVLFCWPKTWKGIEKKNPSFAEVRLSIFIQWK